ncbi:MAG: hypothetical protein DRJ35_00060 [Thermoprotei archaeon]|nr:MAG: hypothetical protein DRJ35_00060 [Thermoprotei archaeon]
MTASKLDSEKEKLINQVIIITNKLIESTKSRKISIKLRTLLRYAYVSYIKKTTDINIIRGLVPRIRPPARLTNQYYYREIERVLKQKFNARIENRRQFRYVVLYKK